MNIIINADDCGYSKIVNQHIEQAIVQKRISSTTIMANMEDFDGAVELYNKYHEIASFGFHMNLTEGSPLLYSQRLLDMGFYKEENEGIIFNSNPFRRKLLSKDAREDIYKEVYAQLKKIIDAGVDVSHIDGHHFIHQAVFMSPLLPKLCKEMGIHKIRNYRNYMPASLNRMLRGCWSKAIRCLDKDAVFTDWFTSYGDFLAQFNSNQKYYKENDTIELMCHPGGIYEKEEDLLMHTTFIRR